VLDVIVDAGDFAVVGVLATTADVSIIVFTAIAGVFPVIIVVGKLLFSVGVSGTESPSGSLPLPLISMPLPTLLPTLCWACIASLAGIDVDMYADVAVAAEGMAKPERGEK
jgi:hypothetical protein